MSLPLWVVAAGALVLLLVGWLLYEHYLHPAWRRQRRVMRACEKAFDDGRYRLECFRVSLGDPGISDLFPALPFGSKDPSRYYTYKIKTAEGVEPDFSGMDREEIGLVRRYLRRNVDVPHYGKKILRSRANETPASGHSKVQA